MKKSKLSQSIGLLCMAAGVWVGISTTIQGFCCPQLTKTELFLHIPNSFVCDFEYCESR